jgi:hypothetical protein
MTASMRYFQPPKPAMVLAGLCMFFHIAAYCSDTTSSTTAPKDSILSVVNLTSHKDSAKINEILVFKLRVQSGVSVKTYHNLYLNGIKVNGAAPWDINEAEHLVYFRLDHKVQHLAQQFLAAMPADQVTFPVCLGISKDDRQLLQYPAAFQLEVNQNISAVGIWLMFAILIVLIGAGLKFNILKDDNNLYYSLGRTQMLYWTLLFALSYLYLCRYTGTLPDIPSSILVILGISAATTATSKVLENSHKDKVPIDPKAKSEGFFLDILSDGSSINIQRFQNVVFNLLFGIIFIQKTLSVHLMPDFDNNVLLMLGISAGTYAGMKATEATKEQNKPAPPVNSDSEPAPNNPIA